MAGVVERIKGGIGLLGYFVDEKSVGDDDGWRIPEILPVLVVYLFGGEVRKSVVGSCRRVEGLIPLEDGFEHMLK